MINYKKIFSTVLLLACLSLNAAAYTEISVGEAPKWQIDWSYNQARPDWQEPNASDYANFTVMFVTIEEALQPYVSDDDLMAVFINGEIRGLSGPATDVSTGKPDATHFLLKAYGNENIGDLLTITLQYYNAQLKQVFSRSTTMICNEEADFGIEEDFVPDFTFGSPKYPVVTSLYVTSTIAAEGIRPSDGDMVGAFVGDECRGVITWSVNEGQWPVLNAYKRNAEETVTLKYYDSANSSIITLDEGSYVLTGDVNSDGIVDVSDYIGIANYIMGNTPSGFNKKSADVNGDGLIDVSDYIGVANIILYGKVKP